MSSAEPGATRGYVTAPLATRAARLAPMLVGVACSLEPSTSTADVLGLNTMVVLEQRRLGLNDYLRANTMV
jgi:hypothetical protein